MLLLIPSPALAAKTACCSMEPVGGVRITRAYGPLAEHSTCEERPCRWDRAAGPPYPLQALSFTESRLMGRYASRTLVRVLARTPRGKGGLER